MTFIFIMSRPVCRSASQTHDASRAVDGRGAGRGGSAAVLRSSQGTVHCGNTPVAIKRKQTGKRRKALATMQKCKVYRQRNVFPENFDTIPPPLAAGQNVTHCLVNSYQQISALKTTLFSNVVTSSFLTHELIPTSCWLYTLYVESELRPCMRIKEWPLISIVYFDDLEKLKNAESCFRSALSWPFHPSYLPCLSRLPPPSLRPG